MNVIALYDLHGNLDALEAVLADPRAAGANAIVVGGDVVPGAFSEGCLSLLRGLELPSPPGAWQRQAKGGRGRRERPRRRTRLRRGSLAVHRRRAPDARRRWPDQDSTDPGLVDPVDPVDPMFVTKLFERVE
jgi:hypothetical protein